MLCSFYNFIIVSLSFCCSCVFISFYVLNPLGVGIGRFWGRVEEYLRAIFNPSSPLPFQERVPSFRLLGFSSSVYLCSVGPVLFILFWLLNVIPFFGVSIISVLRVCRFITPLSSLPPTVDLHSQLSLRHLNLDVLHIPQIQCVQKKIHCLFIPSHNPW